MAYTGKNPKFDSVIVTDVGTGGSVAAPASGSYKIINRAGTFKSVAPAGTEKALGSGSGEKTYIQDPDVVGTTWVASGAGVTVANTTTAAELPEESKGTGIKLTGVSGTDYMRARFTLDDADKSKKLKIQFDIKTASAYVANDFKVEVYTNTASNYGGTYTALNVQASSQVPKVDDGAVLQYAFDSTAADYYEVRITRVTGTSFIVISGVIVGPGVVVQGAVVTGPTSYTPTFTGLGTVTGINVYYTRVGSKIRVQGGIKSGTVAAASISMTLPTGLTINTTSHPANQSLLGVLSANSNAPVQVFSNGDGFAVFNDTSDNSKVFICQSNDTTGNDKAFAPQNGSAVLNNNSRMAFFWEADINEWAGSGTVNLSQNNVESAYNSDVTATASVTATGFVAGNVGVAFSTNWAVGTDYTRRVRFISPKQRGETLDLWVEEIATGKTFPANQILYPHTQQGTVSYGWQIVGVSGSETDFDVIFKAGGFRANSATYAQNGQAWSVLNASYKWFVVKAQAGQAVAFGKATGTGLGLTFLPTSQVYVSTGNGFGSTATRRRRFSVTPTGGIVGTDVVFADSAANGSTFTCAKAGYAVVTYGDKGSAQHGFAISRNSAGNVNPGALTSFTQRLAKVTLPAGLEGTVAWGGRVAAGDVLEAIADSANNGTDDETFFCVAFFSEAS